MVWRSGNGVGHINEVKLRRARLVLGLVTTFGGSYHPGIDPGYSGLLSLAISPWIGTAFNGNGLATAGKKQRVLCTSGLVARTAGILP